MISVAMYFQSTTTYGSLIPGSEYIRGLVRRGTISPGAVARLRWMDHYSVHGNARLTCRHFDISAQTFYRWKRRFDPFDLTTLEDGSHRPLHAPSPQTPPAVVERILALREKYPRWGKMKLVVLLKREGIQVSASSVGRVMKRLRERGVLVEPLNVRLARETRKRRRNPRYAIRKPPGYVINDPGDLVQVDTVQIKFRDSQTRYQFSARDAVSRWDTSRAYHRATSLVAAAFLEYMEKKFPFSVRAIQIDGGSEFKKNFEEACRQQGIRLFVIPPRSPKLQGYVERSNRTHREEFYEVEDIELLLEGHNQQLEAWNKTYNYIRPHQSLGYQTPHEFYSRWLKEHKKTKYH